MHRYGVSYLTYKGSRGHAVIERASAMTSVEIIEQVNADLRKYHDYVTKYQIDEMSAGASLASKILIKAANIFLR